LGGAPKKGSQVMNVTRIEHADEAELKRKLIVILESMGCVVIESAAVKLENYTVVRERYHLATTTMASRLKRFRERGGDFPKVCGESGRIRQLHVTPQVDELLRKAVA
jgi:hypothetical protein